MNIWSSSVFFFSCRRRHTRCALVTGVQTCALPILAWLRSLTTLPIILKGICHPEDARHAIDAGADAIFCSNHGGRQANGGIAAIDMLPDVVAAACVVPVLFDSGVRSGSDVVKALAPGARGGGAGGPVVYCPAPAGREGAGR